MATAVIPTKPGQPGQPQGDAPAADPGLMARLGGALDRAFRPPGKGTTKAQAKQAETTLDSLGISAISIASPDERIEAYLEQLWHAQDAILEEYEREWRQVLLYCANEQIIAYHRDRRTWIPRRTQPWRVRSIYNVMQKAVNVRVSRLVENKPAVTVQAQTADRDDVEKAEYKETLFWYLWERLYLHLKITKARRWASKTGSGFLKGGWDPEAGCEYPATKQRVKMVDVQVPVTDPATGQPAIDPTTGAPQTEPQQQFGGIEEYYVDAKGNDLGPVLIPEPDPVTQELRLVRAPVPDACALYNDGEAFIDVRSPFSVRFDRYVEDISESWYVQDAEILPMSKIAAMYPDALEQLKDARAADEQEKALQWNGLTPRSMQTDVGGSASASLKTAPSADSQTIETIDREYLVVETWIRPVNQLVRKMWGRNGAILTTVGGKLVEKREAPVWARKRLPFVQLTDTLEEGNPYAKSFCRDLLPLQDDINRARSMRAEGNAMRERLLLWAPQNHGINIRALGGLNGALVTTKSAQHKPEVLQLGTTLPGTREFEMDSIAAAADIGSMNDASTGKLPSAGIAAKAIYALQYADERSIVEASTLQDIALKQLAEMLDQITRAEYKEARKIRLVGDDRSFMVEQEIRPEDLAVDVDYTFTPGSMMSRQKEAVKNELLELYHEKLIDGATVKKHLSTATPDIFRSSYNLQEAKARRTLQKVRRAPEDHLPQLAPAPYDDPNVHASVIEEFMLTAAWELLGVPKQQLVAQLWQAYKTLAQQQAAAAQAAAAAAVPPPKVSIGMKADASTVGAEEQAAVAGAQGTPSPTGGSEGKAMPPAQGAQQLEQAATRAEAPGGFSPHFHINVGGAKRTVSYRKPNGELVTGEVTDHP